MKTQLSEYPLRKIKSTTLVLFLVTYGFISNIPSGELRAKSKRERETGVEKQLTRWFQARAYPDPYYLNEKFQSAWQQAVAMRTPNDHSPQFYRSDQIELGGWTSLNGPSVGRVLSIAIHPTVTTTLFIGTASGGIWKTTNSGTNWTHVPTNLPVLGVPAIVFHPSNGNIILAGTGEVYRADSSNFGYNVWKARGTYGIGIIRSTDGGNTWSQVFNKNMSELFGIQMIRFDPADPNIVYACTTHGLFKSTDAGATWNSTAVLNKTYVSDVVINSANNSEMMAAVGNLVNSDKGIYRTTNGGSSWVKISSAAIPTSFNGFSRFAYLSGSTVYISMGRNDAGENELFRSTNFGSTWTALNNSHHCRYQYWFANAAAILPSRPDTLFIAGVDFYQYRVSATTRTTIGTSMHSDYHDIKFDPSNSNVAYIANDGGVYRTANATAASPTFSEINTGLNISQFYASFGVSAFTADLFVGGLQDNGVWSYNGSWTKQLNGDGGPCVIDPSSNNNVYASNDARWMRKSTTGVGGAYSTVLSSWAFTGDDRTGFMAPVAISPSNPTVLYAASDNLHKTTNSGSSWTNNNATISNNTNYIEAQYKTALALAVSHSNSDKLYVSLSPFSQRTDDGLNVTGNPSVFRSVNGGTSFVNITSGLPQRFILDFAISPTNDDSVFVALGGFGSSHIYVTGNGGSTWADAGSGLPDVPFNAIVFDPVNRNIIYAGCDLGVYVSPDRGLTWFDFNTGMADTDPVMVFDLQISADNKLVAATHGRGAYKTDLYNPGSLPLTLVGFSGSHENGVNKLKWITESESELRHFELERKTGTESFRRIAIIPAKNLQGRNSYSFADNLNLEDGAVCYYRLRIVEDNGRSRYSNVISLRVVQQMNIKLMNNPFTDHFDIKIQLNFPQVVTAGLYNTKGKLVLKKGFTAQSGNNFFRVDIPASLPSGIYFIELQTDKGRSSFRVFKKGSN